MQGWFPTLLLLALNHFLYTPDLAGTWPCTLQPGSAVDGEVAWGREL